MDQVSCLLISLPGAAKNGFGIASSKRTFGCSRDPSTGSDRLDTAHAPAAAYWPMRVSQRMSEMSCQTADSGQQFSLAHHPAAHAGGDGNKHHIAVLAPQVHDVQPRPPPAHH